LSFKQKELILSGLVFIIALITYILTLEPTVSFWDCGEYISTSAKLQVGHPPGAPLFQMLGAFFAMFASAPSKVAYMVNMMSAIFSALTVLFLFWTLVHILIKYIIKKDELNSVEQILVLGSATVGSLAFAFSDSFWFSAVEAEVYAAAMFLTSALFWMGLKWVDSLDKPRGDRWLILMAFVIGLSFGVHFMALLVIPAIGMLYYFKTTKNINIKSFVIANAVVFGILLFIFKLLLPWAMKFYSFFEIFFTNSIGLPFNSGTIIAGLVTIGIFYYFLNKAREKNNRLMEVTTLSVLFILIGFSSWIMLPIRANANTVINENAPTNARELLAYYNREQYGETHLFYGPYYSAYYHGLDEQEPYVDDKPKYEQDKKAGKYIIVNNYKKAKQNFTHTHWGILPRMWDAASADNYKMIAGIPKNSTRRPTFFENMKFMFDYQFGYMYWRYLMWNFVGRQDDIQGRLDNHGNWLSGIKFIDEMHLGSQDNLPSDVKNNKGRNTYYFLPFLLAFIGILYHSSKDLKSFYVVLIAFLMTGLAIVFYTNVRPFEPRERDYAVVGSFYFFAIWLGMGIFALYDYLKKYISGVPFAGGLVAAGLLAAPVLMANQNWDDHNRSHKYSALNNAKAYLDSCQKNAILYTVGDNDTFPLWYTQDVEGKRRDMRLINTALLNTDWYIDQAKRKIYESDPMKITMPHKKYVYGTRDALYPNFLKDTLDIKDFIKLALNDKFTAENPDNGQTMYLYPSRYIRVPVNKENVIKYGIVAPDDADKIVDELILDVGENGLYKAQLAMLDQLANNDWKRPIYFSGGSFKDEDYLYAKNYLQLDGLTYKLVPIYTKATSMDFGHINTETMYNNVMKWDWGNMNKDIYHDPETRRNSLAYRTNLYRLADSLYVEGKKQKAETILDLSIDKMPVNIYGFYASLLDYIDLYYKLEKTEKAEKLARQLLNKFKEYLDYYAGLTLQEKYENFNDIERNFLLYREVLRIASDHNDNKLVDEKMKEFESIMNKYQDMLQQDMQDEPAFPSTENKTNK
jgi:diadenosine tetraphosphate (Ap4A) HIT family hydrolase